VPFVASTGQAVDLTVHGIPPSMASDPWLVSPQVTVTETLVRTTHDGTREPVAADGANVRHGDIVHRTVTISAVGVPAEALPRVEHGLGRGYEVALVASEASTEFSQKGATGTLVRTWDLKVGGRAVAYVSPIAVAYWHPVRRQRLTAGVPGKRWEPLPLDRDAKAAVLMRDALDAHEYRSLAFAAVLGVLSVPVGMFALGWVWYLLPSAADRTLRRHCLASSDPRQWLRAANDWAKAEGANPREALAYRRLSESVFAPGASAPPTAELLLGSLRRLSRRARTARIAAILPGWLGRILGTPRNL